MKTFPGFTFLRPILYQKARYKLGTLQKPQTFTQAVESLQGL